MSRGAATPAGTAAFAARFPDFHFRPFDGLRVLGKVRWTIAGGKVVYTG